MKTTIALSLALLIAATVSAQTPPEPTPQTPPPTTGTPGPEATPPESAPAVTETTTTAQVDVGVQGVDNDTGSAKFTEYREVPKGVVLPLFRLRTDAPNYTLDLSGENVGRTDQHYAFRANTAFLRITGDYNEIPHNWGEGHTLLEQTGRGTWAMSDTLQRAFQTAIEQQWAISKPSVNYAFLSQLVAPSLATANAVDIGLLRKRGFVDFDIMPEAPVSTHVTYFVESRSGTRAAGTSFGFGNVVETPEPINYRTLDLGINAEMPFTEGVLRGGRRVNTFDDILTSYTFDNPFRATDSTDPSAYTAPDNRAVENTPAEMRVCSCFRFMGTPLRFLRG